MTRLTGIERVKHLQPSANIASDLGRVAHDENSALCNRYPLPAAPPHHGQTSFRERIHHLAFLLRCCQLIACLARCNNEQRKEAAFLAEELTADGNRVQRKLRWANGFSLEERGRAERCISS